MSEPLHLILSNASLAHRKKCRQGFQEMNLTDGQPKVLANLLDNEGMLQKELANICCVEPATMTSLLRKMQEDGLIEKRQVSVSGGKRAYCIYLTEKGRSLAIEVNRIMDEAEVIAFEGFTPGEQRQFLEYIKRLTDNLG